MPSEYPVPDMADVQLVDVLRAIADPVRLQILSRLGDGAPCPKNETFWDLDVQKSTLSHHFKTLRESGLTRTEVSGRTHTIQLRRGELDARFPGLMAAVLGEDDVAGTEAGGEAGRSTVAEALAAHGGMRPGASAAGEVGEPERAGGERAGS